MHQLASGVLTMAKLRSISNDGWHEMAARLPIGQKRRGFHSCSQSFSKTNFEYGRSAEGVWCKCYRCGYSVSKPLSHARYTPPAAVQAAVPTDVIGLVGYIAKQPSAVLPVLKQEGLLPYLSRLRISPSYGRLYLPDESDSWCGLDFTGRQPVRWRSPYSHALAFHAGVPGNDLCIVREPTAYLDSFAGPAQTGAMCLLNDSASTIAAAVALASAMQYTRMWLWCGEWNATLHRELVPFCDMVRRMGE